VSIENPNVRRDRDDKNKKTRKKNDPKVSRIEPSLLPVALVNLTRMMMNLANIDPVNNPDIPLMRNPSGFVTTPRIRTVAYLAKAILHDITVCSYCWKPGDLLLAPDGLPWGLAHVIPLCKGGIENLSNIVKCCQTCNTWKGRRIVAPHPETSWAAADSVIGTDLWTDASDFFKGTLVVQPFTMEIATEEEMTALTAQWRRTARV
jgi:5-methylcytosine-specific restriction endonuclease McrA